MIECNICHKKFAKKQGLEYHLIHKVCIKPDKTCNKCGYQFATKAMLKYHIENEVCNNKDQKKKLLLKKKCENYTNEELLIKVAVLEAEIELANSSKA